MLSEADKALIADAVAAAEAGTSAEILCVVTAEVSGHHEDALAWAAAAALTLPPLAMLFGVDFGHLPGLSAGWRTTYDRVDAGALLSGYAIAQALVFALTLLLGAIPALRGRLTPRGMTARRVRQAALRHFAGARLHLPVDRPAVMIYASTGDRQMQVLGDELVHARFGQATWDSVVSEALATIRREDAAAGLARAVTLCGERLAREFPDDGAENAVPNGVVEL